MNNHHFFKKIQNPAYKLSGTLYLLESI